MPDEWTEVRRRTAILSIRPLLDPDWLRDNGSSLLRGAAIGALVHVAIMALHEPVVGVTPFPG